MIRRPPRSTLFPYTRSSDLLARIPNRKPSQQHLIEQGKNRGVRANAQRQCQNRNRRKSRMLRQRSEEHTSELQSQSNLVCRLLLEKKKVLHETSVHGTYTRH